MGRRFRVERYWKWKVCPKVQNKHLWESLLDCYGKTCSRRPASYRICSECSGDVVDKEPGKTYIDVPNEFYAAVTSAVWSGYSDIDGKTWQAGDIPELTVVMRTDISGTNKESYYFAEDFDPSQFIIYDWQDLDQFAENFYKMNIKYMVLLRL